MAAPGGQWPCNTEVLAIATAIQTRNLAKVYGTDSEGRPVGLVDLTLDVEQGHIFGLLGPNGSGKTTTLKLLLGLIFPSGGSGQVFGHKLGDPEYKRRIGFLPEGPYFYDHLNAVELLRFYSSLFGMSRAAAESKIQELLKLVGMWDRRAIHVRNYSRGMLQRIGLAQALLNDPDLVFLDEPTAGLDPQAQIEMRSIILKLREEGKTVFLCSHLLKDMEPICDTVAIVARGTVRKSGTMIDMLAGDHSRYAVTVAGSPQQVQAQLKAPAVEVKPNGTSSIAIFADQATALAAAAQLGSGGARILNVGPDRRTLEEVFVEAIGGDQ
jgi:ABC-2 type transport system ATP-binding protein